MYPIRYFTLDEVKNIKTYKFTCEDTPNLSTKLVAVSFERLHKLIPDYITPNQITWFGGISMLLSFLITIFADPRLCFKKRWLPLLNLVLQFSYFSADFMDGMHARRTGQCSALGGLLDHGIDSLVCTAIIVALTSSLRLGISKTALYFCYNMYFGFYSAGIYLKYVGLFKNNLLSGESRGLLVVMLIHLLSFLFPGALDKTQNFLGSKFTFFTGIDLFLPAMSIIHTVINLSDVIYNIYTVKKASLSYEFLVSYLQMILFIVLLCLSFKNIFYEEKVSFFLSLLIFSLSFTTCYIEENLSILTKTAKNTTIFLVSYTFIILSIIAKKYKHNNTLQILIFVPALIHFLVRVGSILYNMAVALNVKLGF